MNAKLIGRNLNNRRFWRTSGMKLRGSYRFHWTAKWCRVFGDEIDYTTVHLGLED